MPTIPDQGYLFRAERSTGVTKKSRLNPDTICLTLLGFDPTIVEQGTVLRNLAWCYRLPFEFPNGSSKIGLTDEKSAQECINLYEELFTLICSNKNIIMKVA